MRSFAHLRQQLNDKLQQKIDQLRLQLSSADALLAMSILGTLAGFLTGLIIVLFRLVIDWGQYQLLTSQAENYELLPPDLRFCLALLGALLIGILLRVTYKGNTQVGVIHVMERLAYHQGYLPIKAMLVQFVAGTMAIISGQPVGREGPGVHLGAASSSQMGQLMGLPNNSIRQLVACGTAAAIAASFNTPLAGVILAMEVVMMEYTITGFAPVILAAVAATAMMQLTFGGAAVFEIPPLALTSLTELPFLIAFGIVTGILSSLFIILIEQTTRLTAATPIVLRLGIAGLITGLSALVAPQIMGIGYDTLNLALTSNIALKIALLVTIIKLISTALVIGLGMPGGLIGPTLIVGATTGSVLGWLGAELAPGQVSEPGFYALIGMVSMMGATLHAPLTALISMLELTGNPNIILPGMLTVVTALIISRRFFGHNSVYISLMRLRGLDYKNNPIAQILRRTGVAGVMERRVQTLPRYIDPPRAQSLIDKDTRWMVIEQDNTNPILLPAADLARHLINLDQQKDGSEEIDLLAIPAQRLEAGRTQLRASLQDAYELLESSDLEAVVVDQQTAPGIRRIYGVLTREAIENRYH